jgi:hypothetical protein
VKWVDRWRRRETKKNLEIRGFSLGVWWKRRELNLASKAVAAPQYPMKQGVKK